MPRKQPWRRGARVGFTLIEVLLVVVIIAIVAATVLTRVFIARQRANESQTRGNLRELRRAVRMFENDMGAYPVRLIDVCARTVPNQGLMVAGNSVRTVTFTEEQKKEFKGPYYEYPTWSLPPNALTRGSQEGVDWIYNSGDPATLGSVQNGAPGLDSTGAPYSDW